MTVVIDDDDACSDTVLNNGREKPDAQTKEFLP